MSAPGPSGFRIDQVVEHPGRPGWGPGRVLAVAGAVVTVYFRDVEETRAGEACKRIDTTLVRLRLAAEQREPWLECLRLTPAGGPAWTRARWTVEEATTIFEAAVPGGFRDPAYVTGHREPVWRAHRRWEQALGHGQGRRYLRAGGIEPLLGRILEIASPVTLLDPSLRSALRRGLADRAAGRRFAEALFAWLEAPEPVRPLFESLGSALAGLPFGDGPVETTSWPLLTGLPFLADPGRHPFLDPRITDRAAERLAFDLRLSGPPSWAGYRRVRELGALLLSRLEPAGARDLLDVHGFLAELARAGGAPAAPARRGRRGGREPDPQPPGVTE